MKIIDVKIRPIEGGYIARVDILEEGKRAVFEEENLDPTAAARNAVRKAGAYYGAELAKKISVSHEVSFS